MKVLGLALMAPLLLAPAFALDVRGVRIGQPFNVKVLEAALNRGVQGNQGGAVSVVVCHASGYCEGHTRIKGCEVHVQLGTAGTHKVTSVFIKFPIECYPTLLSLEKKAFGQPSQAAGTEMVHRKLIKTYLNTWRDGNIMLFLDRGVLMLSVAPPPVPWHDPGLPRLPSAVH
jgi:hypothetical protein